jgi:hypothetical protein
MKGTLSHRLALVLSACLISLGARAEPALTIKPLAERKVSELPAGELYWRIENVDSLEKARAAAGAWSLVAESAGKIWLFTLGPSGAGTSGAIKVAEVGPIPRVTATQFLLRINDASGPPGSSTPIHSHPGSEAFFVLEGEQSIRGADGTLGSRPAMRKPCTAPTWPCRYRAAGRSVCTHWSCSSWTPRVLSRRRRRFLDV